MSKAIHVLEMLALWAASIGTLWAAYRSQSLAGWLWLFGILELAGAALFSAYQISVWGSGVKVQALGWLLAGVTLTLLVDGWILRTN